MSVLAALRYRLRTWLRPELHARELDEEIRFHLELDAMARNDAARRFGNVTHYKEEAREVTGLGFLDTARQDLRFAVRTLRHSPGFAAVAVITIALGIGATTAIFSVVNAVVLRPLPYPDAQRVVMVWMDNRRQGLHEDYHSYPNLADLKARNRSLSHLAPYRQTGLNLTGGTEPRRVEAGLLPAEAFGALGVQPELGRLYATENETTGNDDVVILSHGLWQSEFAGDRAILGRRVELDGRKRTVIGIMPADFAFPSEGTQLWVPLVIPDGLKTARSSFAFPAVGRLAAGVSLAAARIDLAAIGRQLETEYPNNRDYGVTVTPLPEQVVGPTLRTALWIMLGAVAAVLLIACANVANLLLSRAATREREVTVRMALGASNRRLVRQFLTESLLLSVLGGLAGLGIGVVGLRALRAMAPSDLPRAASIGLDLNVLIVTIAATLVTGLFFGLMPAIQTSRARLGETLREGGRGGTAGRAGRRLRRGIVAAQLALVVVLLVGAGLLLRTFAALQHQDLGFDDENVLTFTTPLPAARYSRDVQVRGFYETLLDRIRALPDVRGAGTITTMMLSRTPNSTGITAEGRPNLRDDIEVTFDVVTPRFFETIGARMVAGRDFGTADRDSAPPVAIVNEHMAKRYWPNASAIGKRFVFGSGAADTTNNPWVTVVGVVNDMRRTGLDMPVRDEAFLPLGQNVARSMLVMVKTSGDPFSLVPRIRQIVRSIDPNQPISTIRTMDDVLSRLVAQRRFSMTLVAAFALLAFVLAVIGAYGVTSYLVSQRTKEIGVRLALGAEPAGVARLVVLDGLRVAVGGIVVGLVVAMVTTRLASSLLFGVSPRDPLTMGGVAVLLLVVAAVANYIPARRAARVDPLIALRQE
jgi:putative ABC transport system permease protein